MKQGIQKRFSFIVRSMLWSLLFYVVLMLAFNWDDVSNAVSGKNPITIITNDEQTPQDPCVNCPTKNPGHVNIIKGIVAIVKTVTGLAQTSSTPL